MASNENGPPVVIGATAAPPAQPAPEEPQIGFFEKLLNHIRDKPWSVIQLYVMGLVGIAFTLQYIVVIMAMLFHKRLMQIPDSEYEDLSRKDAHMLFVRIMNMNPLGLIVPYPWLVYISLFSAILVLFGFIIMAIKVLFSRSSAGFGNFKRLGKDGSRVAKLVKELEEQENKFHDIDPVDYEGNAPAIAANKATIKKHLDELHNLASTIEAAVSSANEEEAPAATQNTSVEAALNKIDIPISTFIKDIKAKAEKAKRDNKYRLKKEKKDAKETAKAETVVQSGGADMPDGGKYTPNFAVLAPVSGVGLILMVSGIWTFAAFVSKVQEVRKMSDDAAYEKIIKENIPRNREFLEALREFVLGSTKINPYTWPPRTIELSFFTNNESDIDEVVKMMFLYRLASHYVKNIASLENESKRYAAKAVSKRASEVGAMADNIANFLGIMATLYVTDMAPLKRFKGDKAYDDIGALTELFRCNKDKCPLGKVSFLDFYRKRSTDIQTKLEIISNKLSNIVDSPTYSQRLVSQYKIASNFLETFTILNVTAPVGVIVIMTGYCWLKIESKKTRNAVCATMLVFALLPFIIPAFVEWR